MSEDTKKDLFKEILRRQEEIQKNKPPVTPTSLAAKAIEKQNKKRAEVAYWTEKVPEKTEDALDKRAYKKGGFSKAEKREYARQKAVDDLLLPPKNPAPAWLSDPSLLPKKPPPKSE